MAGGEIDPGQVEELLRQVRSPELRNQTAAALSKVAAKAEDDILLRLSEFAADFVSWLDADEPLVRAYTACILANVAFLEPGQQRVLDANGVQPLVRMLKSKSGEDKKVTLHSTAAVQNLTYKNTLCCQEVLEAGGEKALKKLLQHKSDDVQQFAAGALANLQLYRKKEDDAGSGRGGAMRKVAKILRRKGGGSGGGGEGSPGGGGGGGGGVSLMQSHGVSPHEAAATIQACYRGMVGRKRYEQRMRNQKRKGGNKYGSKFNVNDVRAELGDLDGGGGGGHNMMGRKLPGLLPPAGGGGGFDAALGGMGGGGLRQPRMPPRLAPLGPPPGGRLQPLGGGGGAPPGGGMMPMPPPVASGPPRMPPNLFSGGGSPPLGGGGMNPLRSLR